MILTSKQRVEHPFAGQNTQQMEVKVGETEFHIFDYFDVRRDTG